MLKFSKLRNPGESISAARSSVQRHTDWIIVTVVTLLAIVIYAYVFIGGNTGAVFSFLASIEERSLDARFKARGARPHDDRIVIVGIDEKTIQRTGAYPIPRSAFATAVEKLAADGAKVVAFDANFPTPEKNSAVDALHKLQTELAGSPQQVLERIRAAERRSDNDAHFADSLKKANNVVLGHMFLEGSAADAVDEKQSEEYYNTLWGHPFPQVLKAEAKGKPTNFNIAKAWSDAGGPVVPKVSANMRILGEAAKSMGFFDISPDSDGTVRRSFLLIRYQDAEWYPSLALETVRQFEHIKDEDIAAYIAPNGLERIQLGSHNYHVERDGTILINFSGPYDTYQHYSLADVLDGSAKPEAFRGKIVLIGATAIAAGDLRSTPFQAADTGYMGVEVHANIIDNLLNNDQPGHGYLKRGLNEELIDLAFLLAFGIGLGFLFTRARPVFSAISVLVAMSVFGAVNYIAFSHYGLWLNVVIPISLLAVNYGSITSYRLLFEEREKRRVRKRFERYVSPGVIRLMEQNPEKYFRAGGESKELTIMFSDIRGFTSISEGMSPDDLVSLLNEYLGEMTDIVFHRWGTLDKYIGDAVMAFWGSPFPQDDHAIRACHAALDMTARLEELNKKWESEGKRPLEIGLGINTGRVNVGNMGSDQRFAWTVMGDHVNLASRLEGQNKEYHTTRIVSEFTYAQVRDAYVCRDLDRIRVKGKQQPVGIYELMDFARNSAQYQQLLLQWHDAQSAYYSQSFDEAIQKFEALLSRFPDDGPSHTFLKRSHEYLKDRPASNWDGVYTAKSK